MDLLEIGTAGCSDRTRRSKWQANKKRLLAKKIRNDGTYPDFSNRGRYNLSCNHQTLLKTKHMDMVLTSIASILMLVGFFVICRSSDDEEDEEEESDES